MLKTMVMALPYPTGRVARKKECRGQAGLVHVCAAQPTLPICTLLACACSEALPGILTLVLHACALLKLICLIQVCTVRTYTYCVFVLTA